MVDTNGPSTQDQEVEIAALTFECRLAVEAAVLRTRRLEHMPASPTLRAEIDRVGKILEQMADAFEHLHGAITRLICPGGRFPKTELPAASHKDIEEIGAAIVAADRPVGGFIEEAELARALGKEPSIVRDAAIWLEGRGLVKRMGDLGVRANSFSETDLRELFEIRQMFEPIACGLAASAMSEDEIACLANTIEPRRTLSGRPATPAAKHPYGEFHVQIILASQNASLIELLCDNLHYKISFYRDSFQLRPEWQETASIERWQIVEALAARDSTAAANAMRTHLASTQAATVWTGKVRQTCKIEDFAAHRRARRMLPV